MYILKSCGMGLIRAEFFPKPQREKEMRLRNKIFSRLLEQQSVIQRPYFLLVFYLKLLV